MGWFGRKAAQETARPFLLRGFGALAGQGIIGGEDAPRSYEAQVREAVCGNAVAQRAVRMVAEAVGSVTIDGEAGLLTPILLETAAMQLLLHGNVFVQPILGGDGVPVELFPLRPERVKVETDGSGWPEAYLYRAGEARRRIAAFDAEGRPGVIHLRSPHPLDDHYGLGCLGAAAGAVAAHTLAARWNRALLEQGARPSGALVYDPGDGSVLAPAQYERLKEELTQQFGGAANAGRPLLLDGGLSWQAMSLTPAEMDFAGMKAAAAREIALAFGVPPMLLGLPGDSTYANYREAVRSLWRLTVLPMAERIVGGLGAGLVAWWPELKLAVDHDAVSALHADRAELWAAVNAADFLTLDEKRVMLGFRPAEKGGDNGE